MRLGYNCNRRTKEITSYYVQKSVYGGKDHDNKTVIVKRLGTPAEIRERYGVEDADAWARAEVKRMNDEEKENSAVISVDFDPSREIPSGEQKSFNVGYLFLQDIYYELGLNKICKAVALKHDFQYNLNSILSRLVYSRILFPGSKLNTFEEAGRFLEQPDFDLHQVYRSLSVLASESDYIQSRLFKNSQSMGRRNTSTIYYDCTNYYFEIEQADGCRQYGPSKENRPLPIVEMGLFMDSDGIPLSFAIHPGNENEQNTLIPLEKKMLDSFGLSRFIVCTDAGLSSFSNRLFNDYSHGKEENRAYISTVSLKKMSTYLQDWALDPSGWFLHDDDSRTYDISQLDAKDNYEKIFYKKRAVKESKKISGEAKELESFIIVSFSLKYRDYLRHVRNGQIERARKLINKGKAAVDHKRPNDVKRLISEEHVTNDGVIADIGICGLDEKLIREEEKYDGFYAVSTDLDEPVEKIIRINKRRWEIEECFRIMKSDFEARPVYLHRQDRIIAHFITCFISLIIYRYLEKSLGGKYTVTQILQTLRDMNMVRLKDIGYIPAFTRTEITDALCSKYSLDLSKELVTSLKMRNICSMTRK